MMSTLLLNKPQTINKSINTVYGDYTTTARATNPGPSPIITLLLMYVIIHMLNLLNHTAHKQAL